MGLSCKDIVYLPGNEDELKSLEDISTLQFAHHKHIKGNNTGSLSLTSMIAAHEMLHALVDHHRKQNERKHSTKGKHFSIEAEENAANAFAIAWLFGRESLGSNAQAAPINLERFFPQITLNQILTHQHQNIGELYQALLPSVEVSYVNLTTLNTAYRCALHHESLIRTDLFAGQSQVPGPTTSVDTVDTKDYDKTFRDPPTPAPSNILPDAKPKSFPLPIPEFIREFWARRSITRLTKELESSLAHAEREQTPHTTSKEDNGQLLATWQNSVALLTDLNAGKTISSKEIRNFLRSDRAGRESLIEAWHSAGRIDQTSRELLCQLNNSIQGIELLQLEEQLIYVGGLPSLAADLNAHYLDWETNGPVAFDRAADKQVQMAADAAVIFASSRGRCTLMAEELLNLYQTIENKPNTERSQRTLRQSIFELCGATIEEIKAAGSVEKAVKGQIHYSVSYILQREIGRSTPEMVDWALAGGLSERLSASGNVAIDALAKGSLPTKMQMMLRQVNVLKVIVEQSPELKEASETVTSIILGERTAWHIPAIKTKEIVAVLSELQARAGFGLAEGIHLLALQDGSTYLHSANLQKAFHSWTGTDLRGLEPAQVEAALKDNTSLISGATMGFSLGYHQERRHIQKLQLIGTQALSYFLPPTFTTIVFPTCNRPEELNAALTSYLESAKLYHPEEPLSFIVYDDSNTIMSPTTLTAVQKAVEKCGGAFTHKSGTVEGIRVHYVGREEKHEQLSALLEQRNVDLSGVPSLIEHLHFNRNFIALTLNQPYITVDDDSLAMGFAVTQDRAAAAHILGISKALEAGKEEAFRFFSVKETDIYRLYSGAGHPPDRPGLYEMELSHQPVQGVDRIATHVSTLNGLKLVHADVVSAMNMGALHARVNGAQTFILESATVGDRDISAKDFLEMQIKLALGESHSIKALKYHSPSTSYLPHHNGSTVSFTTATGIAARCPMPCPTSDLTLRIDDFYQSYLALSADSSFERAASYLALLHERGPRKDLNLAANFKSEIIGTQILLPLVVNAVSNLKKHSAGIDNPEIFIQAITSLRDQARALISEPNSTNDVQSSIDNQVRQMLGAAKQLHLNISNSRSDGSEARKLTSLETMLSTEFLLETPPAEAESKLKQEIVCILEREFTFQVEFLTLWNKLAAYGPNI